MKAKFTRLLRNAAKSLTQTPPETGQQQAPALHQLGDLQAASRLYQDLVLANPEHAELYYQFANVLKDQGIYAQALDMYDYAIDLKPQYSQAYCNRAVVLGHMNRHSESLESYNRA